MHFLLAWWKVFLEQTRWWKPCIAKRVIACLRSYSSCVHSLLTIASYCSSICVLRSSIRKVSLAKTYTYRDRANFETPYTLLRYLGFRLSRSCSCLTVMNSHINSSPYVSVGSTLVLKSFMAVSNDILCRCLMPLILLYCIVLYCVVLYCIEGVVIAALMHCDLFRSIVLPRITTTWICRLNFAKRPIFFSPEISDSEPSA